MSLTMSHAAETVKPRMLGRVYAIMALAAVIIAMVPELLNHFEGAGIPTSILMYAVIVLTGAWATRVASLGYGAIGGALTGFLCSLTGGVVYAIIHHMDPAGAAKTITAAVLISLALGAVLGVAGGTPVWLWGRGRKQARHPG
jgi:hypothetical protein